MTSLYGSSCANNGKGALNTPQRPFTVHSYEYQLIYIRGPPQTEPTQLITSQPITSQPITSQPITSQPITSQPITYAANHIAANHIHSQSHCSWGPAHSAWRSGGRNASRRVTVRRVKRDPLNATMRFTQVVKRFTQFCAGSKPGGRNTPLLCTWLCARMCTTPPSVHMAVCAYVHSLVPPPCGEH
eukprot:695257-Pyramimonas_sp.AAC.1